MKYFSEMLLFTIILKMVSKNLPIFGIVFQKVTKFFLEKPETQMSSNTTQNQPIIKRAVKFLTRISQTHFHTPLYISLSLYLQDAQEYGKSEKLRCQDLFYCPKSLLELREQYLNL